MPPPTPEKKSEVAVRYDVIDLLDVRWKNNTLGINKTLINR